MVSEKIIVRAALSVFVVLTWCQSVQAMYDPMIGRFASRDPIAYVDGMNAYTSYHVMSKMDPSGNECSGEPWTSCGTNPIGEQDVVGMSWHDVPLPQNVLGRTLPEIKFACNCVECCGKAFIESILVELQLIIQLDTAQLPVVLNPNYTKKRRGVYGHEQRHVQNIVSGMNRACQANLDKTFQARLLDEFSNMRQCEHACSQMERFVKNTVDALIYPETHPPGSGHIPLNGIDYDPLGDVFPVDPTNTRL